MDGIESYEKFELKIIRINSKERKKKMKKDNFSLCQREIRNNVK